MREVVRRSPGMPQDLRQIENCYLNNLNAHDRTCYLPSSDVIANELALLDYGYAEPERVAAIATNLVDSVSEIMSAAGLAVNLSQFDPLIVNWVAD